MKAYLFNNDTFTIDCGKTALGERHTIESHPHLLLELENEGEFYFEILDANEKVLYSGEYSGKTKEYYGQNYAIIKLPNKLNNAKFMKINNKKIELAKQVRVHGRVTDTEGEPLKDVEVVLVKGWGESVAAGAIGLSDADGFFDFYAPEGYYHHIFACDCDYGKEKLEFYGWNLNLRDELELNIKVDKIEIYRVAVSTTPERTILVDFCPMDVVHTVKKGSVIFPNVMEKLKRGEKVSTEEFNSIYPKIKKENVKLFLGGKKLNIWTMEERYHSLQNYGIPLLRRGYIIEAGIPAHLKSGRYDLKIELSGEFEGIKEYGEAIYFDVYIS